MWRTWLASKQSPDLNLTEKPVGWIEAPTVSKASSPSSVGSLSSALVAEWEQISAATLKKETAQKVYPGERRLWEKHTGWN